MSTSHSQPTSGRTPRYRPFWKSLSTVLRGAGLRLGSSRPPLGTQDTLAALAWVRYPLVPREGSSAGVMTARPGTSSGFGWMRMYQVPCRSLRHYVTTASPALARRPAVP